MPSYFNRYNKFTVDEQSKTLPFVKLPTKGTDKFVEYKVGRSRMDKFSNEYYSSPFYGWLIMLANLEYGGLETNIPDSATIRIPFPLKESLDDYNRAIKDILRYYGE